MKKNEPRELCKNRCGAQNVPNDLPTTLNNSKRFFTPIVASSLALFLSAGVANAATKSCASAAGANEPKICYEYDQNNATAAGTPTDASLTDLSWTASASGGMTPQAGGKPLTQLVFRFNEGSSGTPTGRLAPPSIYEVTSGGVGKKQIMVLDGGTKGIEMANEVDGTTGKLLVIFGQGVDSRREFHLNLSQSAGEFSFKGNIVIQAGKGWGDSGGENGNAKFIGDFGKKVIGDIVVSARSENINQSGHKTELTFTNDASLEGSLTTQAGTTTATFENGNITGNVKVDDARSEFSKATNTITFSGQDNRIGGNVTATTGNSKNSVGTNTITFQNNGTIGGNISAARGPTSSTGRAINTITFTKNGTIGGSLSAGGGGSNTITSTGDMNINGNIAATSGANTITMNGATNTIGGNITNNAGTNTITATNQKLTIGSVGSRAASLIEASGGGTAKNTITAGDLTLNASVVSKIANGNSANTNSFTATNLTMVSDKIEVSGDKPNSKTNGNTLSATESADITATTIKATYGHNSITAKDLTLKTDLIYAHGSSSNVGITANNITATGTGNVEAATIKAESGINAISLKAGGLTTTSLEAIGGFNKIKLEGNATFSANTMSVVGNTTNTSVENGNNLIDITGESKLSVGTLTATQGNPNTNGANVFAFRENGEITIKESYSSSNGGKNLIASVVVGSNTGGVSTPSQGLLLSLEDKQVDNQALLETYGESYKQNHDNALLKVEVKRDTAGSAAHSFTLTGLASGAISKISDTLTSAKLTLTSNSAFVGNLEVMDTANSNTPLLEVEMQQASKLLLEAESTALKTLTLSDARFDSTKLTADAFSQNNTIVDLASVNRENPNHFRLLTIGDTNASNPTDEGLQGSNGLFRIYLDTSKDASGTNTNTLGGQDAAQGTDAYGYAYSDRILIESGNGGTHHAQILYDGAKTDISKISYKEGTGTENPNNIAIATIKTSTNITLASGTQLLGYDVVGTQLDSTATDANGKTNGGTGTSKDYTTYFIKSMDNQGASKANQLSAITALSNNYMLYLANLNSLNKRMGELRENTASQGAWIRIFNGMQSTNFKEMLDSRAIYTTIQAGYDYTFGFKGASNYLGFALSYANTLGSSESYRDINGIDKGLKNMNSNAFEFAIYNAYVQDGASKATGFKNGLYSDSIAKFSYILGSYNFLDQSNKTYDTNNFAFTLSQELGYRFLLGNDKEFYIDPQAELAFGFFSNSNLAQSMGNNFFLKAMQDSILTLRSRVGSSFGYKFDKFTQNKGFNSSLYLGTYFVSDVILGGEVSINTNANKPLEIKPLTSDMRFVLNLGTNFKIKDNTRIYFDFERSFGGKITTDYQLNLGVRYSFGTSKYTPYTETTQEAPKDNNTLKEVEPTKGYYIELLEKEDKKLTNKELKTLQNLKEELRIQTKTQNNKTLKAYLAGPYKDEKKAKEAKTKLEGIIKELKGKGSILEVE